MLHFLSRWENLCQYSISLHVQLFMLLQSVEKLSKTKRTKLRLIELAHWYWRSKLSTLKTEITELWAKNKSQSWKTENSALNYSSAQIYAH